jgi:hypothetical protein
MEAELSGVLLRSGMSLILTTLLAKSRTEASTPPTDPRIWERYREDNKRLDALLSQ